MDSGLARTEKQGKGVAPLVSQSSTFRLTLERDTYPCLPRRRQGGKHDVDLSVAPTGP